MDSDKYVEGQSMQRLPLFESDSFVYLKNRFETYVKSKDLDLWHVIINGDFQPIEQNPETKLDEVIPFERKSDDLKKRLAKNYEAEMVIYNALPRKEYEKNFMCNTAKEIWKTLLITHQDNSQVKDNNIDLLVQQYEQFVISEDESIDSMDKTKITRKQSKTGKHGHENRKSTKEAKDAKPKPEKVNLQSKLVKQWSTKVNSRARLQDGRERLVKSSFSLTHSQAKATWLWKKAQGELGFTLGSLREVTQGSHQGLPAWQSV
ncbi:hypothetical protein Tco_0618256 [Tanacetum coccineum]